MALKDRGFTLLEIIVAVSVLGVAVAVAMQIFAGGLKNIRRIDLAHQAMEHAENVMSQILSDEDLREPAELAGELDDEFSYSAVVDYWDPLGEEDLLLEVAKPRVTLMKVHVKIHFRKNRHGKRYEANCLKLVPNEMAGGVQGGASDPLQQLLGR